MSLAESAPDHSSQRGLGPALLWACFLGSSWTWVIGMFFPTLLVRDFGVAGWWVFAIPNVVGAAAMGFVLHDAGVSRRLTERHATACRWFSGVTIAFQVYVVMWLVQGLWLPLLCILPWLVMGPLTRQRVAGWLPWAGVAVSLLSWGVFSYATKLPEAWSEFASADSQTPTPRLERADLWLFLPASILGFALCPYLDLTFHRARQSTGPGTGRAAFAIGFGVVFFSMIVFSLCYAGIMAPVINTGNTDLLTGPWKALLAIHIGVQVAYTVTLHTRERFDHPAMAERWTLLGLMTLLILAVGGAVYARQADLRFADLSMGEVGYRSFLLLYGSILPGYVWLCMIPTLRPGRSRNARWLFAITAIPTLILGFLALVVGEWVYILGLIGVLAIARVVLEILPASDAENLDKGGVV